MCVCHLNVVNNFNLSDYVRDIFIIFFLMLNISVQLSNVQVYSLEPRKLQSF